MKNCGSSSKILAKLVCQKAVTEKISAQKWKNHFKNLHSESRDQSIPLIAENTPSKVLNKPFKMKELLLVIKKMKNKKDEGIDKIAIEMIKPFPEKILKIILLLFNNFLETGKITDEWCEGLSPNLQGNEKITLITIEVFASLTLY